MRESIKTIKQSIFLHKEFFVATLLYQGLFVLVTKSLFEIVKSFTLNEFILRDKQLILNFDVLDSFLSFSGLITGILIAIAASIFQIQNLGLIFIRSDVYNNTQTTLVKTFRSAFKRSVKKILIVITVNLFKIILLGLILGVPAIVIFFLYQQVSSVTFWILTLVFAIIGISFFLYVSVRMIFIEQIICFERRKYFEIFRDHLSKQHFWELARILILWILFNVFWFVIVGGIIFLIKNKLLAFLLNYPTLLPFTLSFNIVMTSTIVPIITFLFNSFYIGIITDKYFYLSRFSKERNDSNPQTNIGKFTKYAKKYRFFLGLIFVLYFSSNMTVVYPIVSYELKNINRKVGVSAHRGSSERAPENTLAAFSAAIEDGADFIEFDVQETKDGVVVVLHDEDLLKVAGIDKNLCEFNYSDLAKIDVGSSFSHEFKNERIPSLQEVIDLAKGRIKLIIEIKIYDHNINIEDKIVNIVSDNDILNECIVISSNYESLIKVRTKDPSIKIGLLIGSMIGDYSELDVDLYVISAPIVATKSFMKNVRKKDKEVFVYPELNLWSLNPLENGGKFIDYGVDNLIVDDPVIIRKLIDEMNSRTMIQKINAKFKRYFE